MYLIKAAVFLQESSVAKEFLNVSFCPGVGGVDFEKWLLKDSLFRRKSFLHFVQSNLHCQII